MFCVFATKQNALIQHCLVKSKIRYQNTLPKYVTICNVYCVTYSGFFFFLHNCKAGFSDQANFLLAAWRHTYSELLKGHLLLSAHITISSQSMYSILFS